MDKKEISHTLPSGYILNDKYIIDYVRGEGGFGITYVGHIKDSAPQQNVAIKEYFPSGVASRDHSRTPYRVTHFNGDFSVSFRKGLQRFLYEAVLLKKFAYLESIVSILDVFETNNTAYLIMEYIDGINLKQLISNEGTLPFSDIYSLMLPVMKDLAIIHEQGLIHRDISPDNLLIGLDNRLHLIDFGSVSVANPNETKTVTVILKAGYAPPEQYLSTGHIGPWTDVYGLCGTIYYALIGKPPVDALIRMQKKDEDFFILQDDTEIETYQWNTIIKGLSLDYSDRFSSVKMLYQAFTTPEMPEEPITVMMTHNSSIDKPNSKSNENTKLHKSFKKRIYIAIAAIILAMSIGLSGNQLINKMTEDITIDTVYVQPQTKQILSMIDVSGLTLENAATKLSELDSNIKIKTIYRYDSSNNIGIVISQTIPAKSSFTKGELSEITLTISKGAEPSTEVVSGNNNNNSSDSTNDSDIQPSSDNTNNTVSTVSSPSNNTDDSENTEKKSTKNKKSKESEFTTIHLD